MLLVSLHALTPLSFALAEVYSDLYGERGCLMGGIQGMFKAQYDVLRANGHSPSEAFNEVSSRAPLAQSRRR